jgi:hypothetical protein
MYEYECIYCIKAKINAKRMADSHQTFINHFLLLGPVKAGVTMKN